MGIFDAVELFFGVLEVGDGFKKSKVTKQVVLSWLLLLLGIAGVIWWAQEESVLVSPGQFFLVFYLVGLLVSVLLLVALNQLNWAGNFTFGNFILLTLAGALFFIAGAGYINVRGGGKTAPVLAKVIAAEQQNYSVKISFTLQDPRDIVTYEVRSERRVAVGEPLQVQVGKGLLGFDFITEVVPITDK